MPAETPVYGLPYQVGSDPPCFGPGTGCDNLETLWCDFSEIVETQLDLTDLVIARTATAIPMAQISVFPPADANLIFPGLFDDSVLAFDTVVFDTDNMADLPYAIRPRRDGIYRIDASMMIIPGPADNGAEVEFALAIGDDTSAATLATVCFSGLLTTLRTSTLYQFSGGSPSPGSVRLTFQTPPSDAATLTYASITMYWHSDA